MSKFKFRASATVSCWTEVEADNEKEAFEIAQGRELSSLCYAPFSGDVDEEWHFDNDGCPFDIEVDS